MSLADTLYNKLLTTYAEMAKALGKPYGYVDVDLKNGGRTVHAFFMGTNEINEIDVTLPRAGIAPTGLVGLVRKYGGERHFSFMVKDPKNGYGGFRLGQSGGIYDVAADAGRMSAPVLETFSSALRMIGVRREASSIKGQVNPEGEQVGLETVLQVNDYLCAREPRLGVNLFMHAPLSSASLWDGKKFNVTINPSRINAEYGLVPHVPGSTVELARFRGLLEDIMAAGVDLSDAWNATYSAR